MAQNNDLFAVQEIVMANADPNVIPALVTSTRVLTETPVVGRSDPLPARKRYR
jgi:hypothetical protein